ncbi:MAG TPA: hypothetical protein VN364_06890, partial [Bellilinea sp.]|nr:hypothetical protein [Bellilinea sp.]
LRGIPPAVSAAVETAAAEDQSPSSISMGLPPGFPLQPAYLIRIFETNQQNWTQNSPDPAGIDFNPAIGQLIIVDSEVDEIGTPLSKPNVFYASTEGDLISVQDTYTTTNPIANPITKETSGVAINPNNQHIFFADDDNGKILELEHGSDGNLWTEDDVWTVKTVGTDAEDVAYGNNMIFVAGGGENEFLVINLGTDGVISPDDGLINAYDTEMEGFSDVEGITFNEVTGTLFLVSTTATEPYLGEFSLIGELLNAWDLSFMGTDANIRSGLTFAPASADPSVDHIYIVSRGIDNDYGVDPDPEEDDGKVWEIALVEPATPTPTDTPTPSDTPTDTPTPTPTDTPTSTDTPTETPTETSTTPPLEYHVFLPYVVN